MPHEQKGGRWVWFGAGKPDTQYLDQWRSAPLTYQPQQEEADWHRDYHQQTLAHDSTGRVFEQARQMILRGKFYPPSLMITTTDAERNGHLLRTGDRILQRIRAISIGNLPILEVLTMNEFTEVIDEPRRAGYTYTTTTAHAEVGAWSALVEWREQGEVVLTIQAISKRKREWMRRVQKRAHHRGIQYFTEMVNR